MHKLIVLGSDWDVYTYAFQDFIDNKHIHYIPRFRPSGILGVIQRIHLNPSLNRKVAIPRKKIWGEYVVHQIIRKKQNLHSDAIPCFLILENWLRMESALCILPTLRRCFPNSKIVCFAQDLVTQINDMYTMKDVDTEYVKKYCDLFITFDTNDAKKYNLEYFPTVFSAPKNIVASQHIEYDFYFLGRNKGRLPLLMNLCKAFNEQKLKCNFQILENTTQNNQTVMNGINYTVCLVDYADNLKCVARSNCIIELLQENASSATFRLWEAITFNKKLLTNNKSIKDSPFYDPRYISTFSSETDIDWNFIQHIAEPAFPDQNPFYKSIQPNSLVSFIEKSLNISIYQ